MRWRRWAARARWGGLRALSLAGCEDVGDAGVAAVARLAGLTALDLRNCCKARAQAPSLSHGFMLAADTFPCLLSGHTAHSVGCIAALRFLRGIFYSLLALAQQPYPAQLGTVRLHYPLLKPNPCCR